MSHRRDLDKFIDETRASQQNIHFPDIIQNGRSVDAFLWRGSPNPTPVQRIGAWMFGLVFMGFGVEFFLIAVKERVERGFSIDVVFMLFISLSSALLGLRTFRNGFPRRDKPGQE